MDCYESLRKLKNKNLGVSLLPAFFSIFYAHYSGGDVEIVRLLRELWDRTVYSDSTNPIDYLRFFMHLATLLSRYTSEASQLKADADVLNRMRSFFTLKFPQNRKLLVQPGAPSYFVELTEALYGADPCGYWHSPENLERRLVQINDICQISKWKVEPALQLFDTHHSGFKSHLVARLTLNSPQQALLLPEVPVAESPSVDDANDDTASTEEIEQALLASGRPDLSQRNAPSAWSPNTQISRPDDVRLQKKKPPRHPFTDKATPTPSPTPSPMAAPTATFQTQLAAFAETVNATGDTALIQQFQNFAASVKESDFIGVLAAPYRPAFPSNAIQPTYPLSDGMFHQEEIDCGEPYFGGSSLHLYWNDLLPEERALWGSIDRYRDLLTFRNDNQTGSGFVSGDIRRFTNIGCRGYWDSRDDAERELWGSYSLYSNILRLRYFRRYGPQPQCRNQRGFGPDHEIN